MSFLVTRPKSCPSAKPSLPLSEDASGTVILPEARSSAMVLAISFFLFSVFSISMTPSWDLLKLTTTPKAETVEVILSDFSPSPSNSQPRSWSKHFMVASVLAATQQVICIRSHRSSSYTQCRACEPTTAKLGRTSKRPPHSLLPRMGGCIAGSKLSPCCQGRRLLCVPTARSCLRRAAVDRLTWGPKPPHVALSF